VKYLEREERRSCLDRDLERSGITVFSEVNKAE
jgi:hypothetical protein